MTTVRVKNVCDKGLKLLDFGVEVEPGKEVEVNADERQIAEIRNTPNLKLVEETKRGKKRDDE